ncbi:hypothetical protein [Desulfosediminicola flagellatus]|uniref:hypothetical protein n=1 Tax=Desulfosediminicola flagellatus TaxID=2569541 RepID=UPI0010AC09C3|nr:hypothetical protein [Desulfosediminicola flagellatus]
MRSFYRYLIFLSFAALLPVIVMAQPSDIHQTQTIFTMPKGHFFENIASGPDEAFYLTDYTGKAIYRYTTESGLTLFKTTDGHPVSLRFNKDGDGLLVVHRIPIRAGPSFTKSMALYRITIQGDISFLKEVPEASFLNGMTMLDEHTFLIGDAIKGIIWKINIQDGSFGIWLKSDALTQQTLGGHIPGVNGIQIYGDDFYAANGDRAQILHAGIDPQGKPARLTILHEDIVVDDFVVDENKTIYATTHGNDVLKVEPDGTIILHRWQGTRCNRQYGCTIWHCSG